MTSNKRPWTADEDKVVLTMIATDEEIGKTIGRTASAVQTRRHRLKRRRLAKQNCANADKPTNHHSNH